MYCIVLYCTGYRRQSRFDWPCRIPSEMPRQACNPQQNVGARVRTGWDGLDGLDGLDGHFSCVGPGGTHLSGSAAQSDLLPTSAQPAQPAHALVVLVPPQAPTRTSFPSFAPPCTNSCPASLSSSLPAYPACLHVAFCPVPSVPVSQCSSVPVPAPAPAKLAISKRTDDVLSHPLPHPQNSILWPLYLHTHTHTHTHTNRSHSTHRRRTPPSDRLLQTSQARQYNSLRQTRPPP